jgi:hypothetical protein
MKQNYTPEGQQLQAYETIDTFGKLGHCDARA